MATTERIYDEIILPEAPRIHGLSFRRFQGAEDYPKMLAVIEASKSADQSERTDTLDSITRYYSHLTNCDPYQDMLFAEVEGEVVAYSRVTWFQQGTGERIYFSVGFIKPDFRRKGLGRAMLRYNQKRLREIAAEHPEGNPRFFDAYCTSTELAQESLLRSEGYQPVRHFFTMVRADLEDIADAVLPEGLEVRPATQEHIRQIWEASQEAFEDHWGYVRESEEDYKSWLEGPWFDPSLWCVAWDGDEVAGMVLSFINGDENKEFNRLRGWTENIAVRRPWRRKGLAKCLLLMSLKAIKERGMEEAGLGVDTENTSGALRLYENVGFRPVKRSSTYRKAFE
jgi:mycothiol synthase